MGSWENVQHKAWEGCTDVAQKLQLQKVLWRQMFDVIRSSFPPKEEDILEFLEDLLLWLPADLFRANIRRKTTGWDSSQLHNLHTCMYGIHKIRGCKNALLNRQAHRLPYPHTYLTQSHMHAHSFWKQSQREICHIVNCQWPCRSASPQWDWTNVHTELTDSQLAVVLLCERWTGGGSKKSEKCVGSMCIFYHLSSCVHSGGISDFEILLQMSYTVLPVKLSCYCECRSKLGSHN